MRNFERAPLNIPMGIPSRRVKRVQVPLKREKESKRLAGDVCHDLKGMITVIRGYTELIQQKQNAAFHADFCRRILSSCTKMTELVTNAFELSRIESGETVLEKQVVDLTMFLKDCLAVQLIKAQEKGITICLNTGKGLKSVSVDPGCMDRIISNLIDNAIKFSHSKTAITLSVEELPESIEIKVQDQGQGIPQRRKCFRFHFPQSPHIRQSIRQSPGTAKGRRVRQ